MVSLNPRVVSTIVSDGRIISIYLQHGADIFLFISSEQVRYVPCEARLDQNMCLLSLNKKRTMLQCRQKDIIIPSGSPGVDGGDVLG